MIYPQGHIIPSPQETTNEPGGRGQLTFLQRLHLPSMKGGICTFRDLGRNSSLQLRTTAADTHKHIGMERDLRQT